MKVQKELLENAAVRLEPLRPEHREPLAAAIRDGELWTIRETRVPHPDQLGEFLENAEARFAAGTELAFATFDQRLQRIVGSTRFMNINAPNLRAEIGFTFLANSARRSPVNTNAKYLMLCHAFDVWGLNRVELITDVLNTTSRAAIVRIGAQQEGVLRSHMVMPDGRIRDSMLFSIIRADWPALRERLEAKLLSARR